VRGFNPARTCKKLRKGVPGLGSPIASHKPNIDYAEWHSRCSLVSGFVLCYWAERGIRKNYVKLLVARLTNRIQFDLQINRELDRLSEIVKIKSACRGIKILYRSDPRGDLQMTKPVPTVPDVPIVPIVSRPRSSPVLPTGGVLRPKSAESLTEESSRC
jgi:hypothetical protein